VRTAGTTLTPDRPIRLRRSRIDRRVILGILLILLSIGGGLAWAATINEGRGVVVATRDLPMGAVLGSDDLTVAQVRIDDALYAAAIPAVEVATLVGKPLGEPVHARQLLVRAQIAGGPVLSPDQVAMTIPSKAESAAGGKLRPGDSVQVLVTTDKGKPTSQTTIVIDRAVVYAIGRDERTRVVSGAGSGDSASGQGGSEAAGPIASVTLILTPDQSLALAHAKWNGDLDVTLLPWAAPKGR